ncbi:MULTISPECIES: DUF6602 domain-containing protein [Vibrio]|uniref:DUF6602 domain-containing protein n=1 Tax=Vibrio TaxID=662 RepID=UPI0011D4D444|nr:MULTISPECIES: DUF6602 domain-containing protein [Vibrio]EGR2537079.1 hypothetical protein [Vibrio cholerae]EGR4190119.1 hypothetical protein [Vibrio cholerae]MBL4305097.1 hypothetical protein [Vibrio fluvialis]MEB3762339.1 hypothetical protein [Vibrio cholerae]TXZ64199.1 hypothetical protein FXE41_11710 [Vibrio cholerae]
MNDDKWLKGVFEDVQQDLQHDLLRASRGVEHAPTKGEIHEDSWIKVLRDYLPKRYGVDKGIVIDSQGNKSDQIDIVIFDPQYTPMLLIQQSHKYIPAEAVYAVFECKPTISKDYLDYAGSKASSVRKLVRTSVPIATASGTIPAKDPHNIICGILAAKCEWVEGIKSKSFESNLPTDSSSLLDIGCSLDGGAFFVENNSPEIHQSKNNLMYFLFTLLAKLQALGTVAAIDWKAYANILREY